jgi:hypothetical protein
VKPFTLPTAPSGPAMLEPLNLCVYGPPGIGKTPICATLPDAIYLDLQRGTLTYTCRRVDVMAEAEERGLPYYEMFEEAAKLARAAKPKFLIVDTIGDLADWADTKALHRFQRSPMGKDFDQPSILDLPGVKGSAGFGKMWDAFGELLNACMGSWHRTIFVGHPRDKIAYATGTDPNVKQDTYAAAEDLDLTGKMRRIFTSKMAAIGFMSRAWEGNRVNVNFTSRDAFSKTRCPHLDGRTMPFSNPCTLAEWARIYPQTLAEHLLPEDRAALATLLAQYGGPAQPSPETKA